MKKLLFAILSVLLPAAVSAQIPMTLKDPSNPLKEQTTVDARVNFPNQDVNGVYCALIKVSVTNTLNNELVLDIGSLAVVAREKMEDGEIWFWIPPSAKNFRLSCEGYTPIQFSVRKPLKTATDYRLEIVSQATGIMVINESVNSDYLNIAVTPPEAKVCVYSGDGALLDDRLIADGAYSKPFVYGKYRVEITSSDGMYCAHSEDIVINGKNENNLNIVLEPDFGYFKLRTDPPGAEVFLDNRLYGRTPVQKSEKLKSGHHTIRIQKTDYYPVDMDINILRDTTVYYESTLRAQFGMVTVTCRDEDAEIWVDNVRKGIGTWTGNLNSTMPHQVEARKTGHQSCSIRVEVKEGETVTREIDSPVPLYAALEVTSEPQFCDVYIDGEFFGQTNFNRQVLSGEHEITVQKKGYKTYRENIVLEHNMKKSLPIRLEKGAINAPVAVSAMAGAGIYIDGVYKGSGAWNGDVPEGRHMFTARKDGYYDREISVAVEYDDNNPTRPQKVSIPALNPITGTMSITGTNGADLSITFPSGANEGGTIPYLQEGVPLGKYSVTASRKGYLSQSTDFVVRQNETTSVEMKLRRQRWIAKTEYFSKNFFEIKYGYGFSDKTPSSHYVGFNYGYLKKHIGFNASFMYGTATGSLAGHIGPSFRLTSYPGLDYQIYVGAGLRHEPFSLSVDPLFKSTEYHWSVDAGMRFNWDHKAGFSWGSFVLGCQISDDLVIPNAGISFIPELLGRSPEDGFAAHFLNLLTGYDFDADEIMMGGSYAWIKTHLGVYCSFLVGFESGYSVTAGPVIRFTTDSSGLDLQMYGGCGVFNDSIAGDLGLRFGWRSHAGFSWWDFTIGCQYYEGCFVPTVGLAIGISYLAGLVGLAYL